MLERVDEAARDRLAVLKHIVVDWVRSEWPGLTNRQLALLMIVCIDPGQYSIQVLAKQLGVPTPITSRILDRLAELGFIVRQHDRRDRRKVYVIPIERAAAFLADLGSPISIVAEP